VHQVELSEPTGDAHDIERWTVRDRRGRHEPQAAVRADRFEISPHEVDLRVRQPVKHLVRPGEVELREPGKQEQADLHGAIVPVFGGGNHDNFRLFLATCGSSSSYSTVCRRWT